MKYIKLFEEYDFVEPRVHFEEVGEFVKNTDPKIIIKKLKSNFGIKTRIDRIFNTIYNKLSYGDFKMLRDTVNRFNNKKWNVINNVVLYYKNDSFLMYKDGEPIGFIVYYYDDSADVYCVSGSYVIGKYQDKGYGTFLYETVMTMVYPKGCTMTRDSGTSPSAVNVWERFYERDDIKKERIYFKGMTHKREDLPNGFMADDTEYVNKVLMLEDTRFFYSYGKDKLESYLKEPMEDFDDILDDFIDRM